MRIAFFGGSFDPPHYGHILIAKAAADCFALDEVWFAPVGSQPLKAGLAMASYADRLAMVEIAVAADARFQASDVDQPKADGSHNYTFDTLSRLKPERSGDTLFCLLGADSFHTLAHWHRAAELVVLCDLIVAARPGYGLERVEDQLPAGVAAQRVDTTTLELTGAHGRSILHLLVEPEEDISATVLRQALQQGDLAADAMLPAGVPAYIRAHSLYRLPEIR